jgi:hypothetical protein
MVYPDFLDCRFPEKIIDMPEESFILSQMAGEPKQPFARQSRYNIILLEMMVAKRRNSVRLQYPVQLSHYFLRIIKVMKDIIQKSDIDTLIRQRRLAIRLNGLHIGQLSYRRTPFHRLDGQRMNIQGVNFPGWTN